MKAELLSVFGDDEMVVDVARVSFDKTAALYPAENNTGLIRFLAREGHWSPFAHPRAQFRLCLPIFVARQWEKHRVGAVRGYDVYDQNEISRRYVDAAPEFFTPEAWRRRPDKSIKQGSGEPFPEDAQAILHEAYSAALSRARIIYEDFVSSGVAPEQARMVLPQSMMTQWIETGSLAYWSRVCTQRLDPHAQKEIRDLAQQVAEAMSEAFPVSWSALIENRNPGDPADEKRN